VKRFLRVAMLITVIGVSACASARDDQAWWWNNPTYNGHLFPYWSEADRTWYLASEAQVAAECYTLGASIPSNPRYFGARPAGCYDPMLDIIYLSDYRTGVPSAPGIKLHEQRHRQDRYKGRHSWHP